jgi:hypothetical protein
MQPLRGNLAPLTPATGRPFAPSDLAALALWLKADAITGLSDGAALAAWNDSSTNARNATQATPSLKPLYKTNIQNGLPVVRFDADDVLAWTQFAVSNQTVFIAHKPAATITVASATEYLVKNTSGDAAAMTTGAVTGSIADERLLWYCVSSALVYGHAYNAGDIAAAWQILTMRFATTPVVSIRRNGINLSLVATRPFTATIYPTAYGQLGANVNSDYAEVIVYQSALSDTDRAKVEAYLSSKWAITLA